MILMAGRYKKLQTFLDDLILEPPTSSTDVGLGPGKDFLTLSTVHSAKGLEWSVVFIIWAVEGYFPSLKALKNVETVEEERRLMYVAATRAKDVLIICYPGREELPFWQLADTGYRNGLSSFIQVLSEEIMEHVTPQGFAGNIRPPGLLRKSRLYREQSSIRSSSSSNALYFGKEADIADGPASELRPGDRVKHPAFGRGVISKFKGNTRVEVLFRDVGRKLLHLEHTTLEKV